MTVDAFGSHAVRHAAERVALGQLRADEVPRGVGRPAAAEPGHGVRGVDEDAAVVGRIVVGDHGHRHEGVRRRVGGGHRLQIDDGQCVAIHQPQALSVGQAERPAGTAGRSEQRLLERVADADAVGGAVSQNRRDGVRQMMQVEDQIADALRRQALDDTLDERPAGDGQCGLGAPCRQRLQARAEACREHECARGRGTGRHGR